MITVGRAEGLVHLGLVYDSPDDLVATVLPHLREALERDHAVYLVVDPVVAQAVHNVLGHSADRIIFPRPETVFGLDAASYVGRLLAWTDPRRRALVLGQPSSFDTGERAWALVEDGVNLVLSDRALTHLCACSRVAGSRYLATSRSSHPTLLRRGAEGVNPDFLPPVGHCAVPAGMWGPCVLRATFSGADDLQRIRRLVAEVAYEAGLRGDAATAAVLAVHEAALVACDAERSRRTTPRTASTSTRDCTLEVRVSQHSMFSEVRERARAVDTAGPPPSARHVDIPVPHVQWFCHSATAHDAADGRTVRVLTDLREPSAVRRRP